MTMNGSDPQQYRIGIEHETDDTPDKSSPDNPSIVSLEIISHTRIGYRGYHIADDD